MNLTLVKKDGQHWVGSRQVAEMVDKEHSNLCRDIRGYLEVLNHPDSILNAADFFKESNYADKQKQKRACYLISRKGCDFIGNKMTGEKGTLFTAAYVSTFHDMDDRLRFQAAKQVDIATKKALSMAAAIQKYMGVKPGIAQATCLGMMEAEYGVDLEPVKKLIPAAAHDTGFLNPTEVGKRLSMNAAKTNLMLAGIGLQEKIEGDWRLTDAGKPYGEEMPFTRNGHSGYQIRWNESVVDLLVACLAPTSAEN
ncbi:MAG: Rha family transcriptional regulator [Anaeromusa sp.]|uniref:Rha family transcriptional regulator n=1 Tax=Anaeromusa sp. TaxID=1872520 RepID=UPI002B1E987B|nr:Rha family transcriptional regulator [Anaeromusa sp.]MEA4835157.1 Rha family transcriptional regulator [Anaeromusa sp.]